MGPIVFNTKTEWTMLHEALSQYCDNLEEYLSWVDDPGHVSYREAWEKLGAAKRILDRMDQELANLAEMV